MDALATAIGALRRVNRWLHLAAGAVLLAILTITVINIFGRQVDKPFAGTVELTQVFMGLMVFLALSYGEDERVHINVDLLYERVGPRPQRWLRLFGRGVAIIFTILMVRQLWQYAGEKQAAGQVTDVYELPFHWFIRAAALGAVMLVLSNIANFLADWFELEPYAEQPVDDADIESAF